MGSPSQSYGTSLGSHSVTCHSTQVNAPHLTQAIQAGTRFTYPEGMEGWIDLVDLIACRPGVELAIFRSRVRRRTTAPPRHIFYHWQFILLCRHCNVWTLLCWTGQWIAHLNFKKLTSFYCIFLFIIVFKFDVHFVCNFQGMGTGESGGQITPRNLPGGVKHGILTPRYFGKKYFLVHRSVDSQQNH